MKSKSFFSSRSVRHGFWDIGVSSILVLLSTILVHSQTVDSAPSRVETFIKHYGEKGKSRGVTVEQTSDQGFIITGKTTDGNYGGDDVLLIKTDPKGNVIWRKTYGGSGDESGWAVRQCKDEGYIVSGFTNSYGQGGMDVYLIRTTSQGDTLWTKTFGGEGDEFGWDVRITKDGEFIIASQTNSYGNGEIDAYLLKVDKTGNELWSTNYGGDKTDRIFSVQEQYDGGFIAAGITYSYESTNSEDRDGFVIKTGASGKLLWHKVYGGNAYDVIHSVSLTNDGGHILTGYGRSYSENGNTDVYLVKCSAGGDAEWRGVYGGASGERGIKGEQTRDGGFIAIGFTENDNNLFVVKTDRDGKKEWSKSFGTPGSLDFGYTVKQVNGGGYILVGHAENIGDQTSKVLLIKTDDSGMVE